MPRFGAQRRPAVLRRSPAGTTPAEARQFLIEARAAEDAAGVRSHGTVGTQAKRKVRSFVIPHIPHDDVVLPEEVQGIRAFGSETEVEALSNLMAHELQTMRNKHATTLEHLRMGALKGVILEADASVLCDLYQEFEITPKVVNFPLTTSSTEVLLKVLEVRRHIEDNLRLVLHFNRAV